MRGKHEYRQVLEEPDNRTVMIVEDEENGYYLKTNNKSNNRRRARSSSNNRTALHPDTCRTNLFGIFRPTRPYGIRSKGSMSLATVESLSTIDSCSSSPPANNNNNVHAMNHDDNLPSAYGDFNPDLEEDDDYYSSQEPDEFENEIAASNIRNASYSRPTTTTTNRKRQRRRRRILVCHEDSCCYPNSPCLVYSCVIIVLVSLMAGCIVYLTMGTDGVFSFNKNNENALSQYQIAPLEMDYPTLDCELALTKHKRPNALTQCICQSRIWKLSAMTKANYEQLAALFIRAIFHENFHENLASCSPKNQALLWLAADDFDYNTYNVDNTDYRNNGVSRNRQRFQRYILALLFIEWNGLGWKTFHNNTRYDKPLRLPTSSFRGGDINYELMDAIGASAAGEHTNHNSTNSHATTMTTTGFQWLTHEHECSWLGVYCNEQKEVISLVLNNNNLQGTLPSEISFLRSLEILSLPENKLHGTLPDSLKLLSNLKEITLFQNSLSGSLNGTQFQTLRKLQVFNLDSNSITGSLPVELGSYLKSLSSLKLSRNKISGSIPTTFGHFKHTLTLLELDDNRLSGTLPSQLGLLENLETLSLTHNNYMSRYNLPQEFQYLTNIRHLLLQRTNLVGTIPSFIGNLTKLEDLQLSMNYLSGGIPSQVGNLSNIHYIQVDSNRLNGTLPSELGLCTGLRSLQVDFNTLHGTIPDELGALTNLLSMKLEGNYFNGTMPNSVCALRDTPGSTSLHVLSASCVTTTRRSPATRTTNTGIFELPVPPGISCNSTNCCTECDPFPE